jgi:hypothetical protein
MRAARCPLTPQGGVVHPGTLGSQMDLLGCFRAHRRAHRRSVGFLILGSRLPLDQPVLPQSSPQGVIRVVAPKSSSPFLQQRNKREGDDLEVA